MDLVEFLNADLDAQMEAIRQSHDRALDPAEEWTLVDHVGLSAMAYKNCERIHQFLRQNARMQTGEVGSAEQD